MKRFIILTSTIRNMGGAQMYAANKLQYYESLGWQPDIYFYNAGPIKIGYLKQFENNLISGLSKYLRDCSSAERIHIIKKILKERNEDDILFECHMPHLAYWGEYISSLCNGKNTVYLLEEKIPRLTLGESDFFTFKLKRKELLNGGGEENLRFIFKDRYNAQCHNNFGCDIKPYCDNVVDYTPVQLPENIRDADYNIISIGRLDKPYIKPMLNEVLLFTRTHNDIKFNFIIVGGDWNNIMLDYIKALFINEKNVNLFLLGYVFPIPFAWINLADVSIASSNSILVSANEGVPTIGIDVRDFQPIGIYGITTNNLWERVDEPIIPISVWLEDILIAGKYKKRIAEHNLSNELSAHLKPHLDLLMASNQSKTYFDVDKMYSGQERLVFLIKKILRPLYLRIIKVAK